MYYVILAYHKGYFIVVFLLWGLKCKHVIIYHSYSYEPRL